MAGLAALPIVASTSIWTLNLRLQEYQRLISNNISVEREISQINYRFKTQVQEWKNVLLRGGDPSSLDKYWGRFKEHQAGIQNDVNQVLSHMDQVPTAMNEMSMTVQEAHKSSKHASEIATGLDRTSGELSHLITRFTV